MGVHRVQKSPNPKIKTKKTEKNVWFPYDENGEPYDKNPYDQCGGFIYHTCTMEYYSILWDDDKEIKRGKNWQETQDLVYREFDLPENQGGCGGSWCEFEKRVNQLEEPDYCLIGQMRKRTGVWD